MSAGSNAGVLTVAGNAAKQDDTCRRRILRDPDVGRQWTDDADGRVFGYPRSARDAIVETIVEEERIIRILRETLLHVIRRERAGASAVTGFTRPAVSTERLLPKQPSALLRLLVDAEPPSPTVWSTISWVAVH